MFNIMILDVAIGMIFIYLLLSLMCSAANEIMEMLLKKRAIDLENGIRQLLNPDGHAGDTDIVQDLYNHPLINGLFEGSYQDSRIADAQRYVRRTLLPSYIPARNFALAVMDLIRPGTEVGQTSGATHATAGPPLPETPSQVVVNVAGVAPPADEAAAAAVPDPAVVALRAALLPPAANADPPPGGNAAANIPQITNQMRRALIPLIDAAGNDMIKVRENIEAWFDTSMQRVSGWYKKRTQVSLMCLGLFIAITLNVDTVTVVKRLSTDKALRESLVAAADAYSKANAQATPTPTPTKDTPVLPAPLALTEACKDPASDDCKRLTEACTDPSSPKCKYAINLQQINSLGLPLGWDDKVDPKRNFTGWSWAGTIGGWSDQLYWHWLGWLLTALAISLGAPFWFDLLNKFMAVRSAVKPQDKSTGT